MRNEKGFTLIELLVVIAIIGILAAIAIPQFQEYRQRGYDSGARADLRNGATAQEAYFIDNDTYLAGFSCVSPAACAGLPGVTAVSATVTLNLDGDATSFTGDSQAASGTPGTVYNWDSAAGGMQ